MKMVVEQRDDYVHVMWKNKKGKILASTWIYDDGLMEVNLADGKGEIGIEDVIGKKPNITLRHAIVTVETST